MTSRCGEIPVGNSLYSPSKVQFRRYFITERLYEASPSVFPWFTQLLSLVFSNNFFTYSGLSFYYRFRLVLSLGLRHADDTPHLSINPKSFLSPAAGGCIKSNVLESLDRQNIANLGGFLPRHLFRWLVCGDKIRSLN